MYIGLTLVAIGTTFVFIGMEGMGEQRGFRTPQLRMTGPALVVAGSGLVITRLLCCLHTRQRPLVTSSATSPGLSEV